MYMYTNLIVSIGEDIDELCDGPGVAQLAQAVRHLMLEQGGLVTEASLHLSRTIVIQFSNQVQGDHGGFGQTLYSGPVLLLHRPCTPLQKGTPGTKK